ncbi:hypothetical protein ACTXT7_017514, partial [Hymenolepis weldensis]
MNDKGENIKEPTQNVENIVYSCILLAQVTEIRGLEFKASLVRKVHEIHFSVCLPVVDISCGVYFMIKPLPLSASWWFIGVSWTFLPGWLQTMFLRFQDCV